MNVKIIEVDGERRRLSLSLKRVEDTDPVQPRADGGESVHARPQIDLSEEVFAEAPVTEDAETPEPAAEAELEAEPEAEAEPEVAAVVDEPEAPAEADDETVEPTAEATPDASTDEE